MRSRRVIVFGTKCSFTERVMRTLLANHVEIAGFIMPGNDRRAEPIRRLRSPGNRDTRFSLPMKMKTNFPGIDSITELIELNDPTSELARLTIAGLDADLALVCCYPARLPLSILEFAKYHPINVHPSLLPKYRGPDPIFWAFNFGDTVTGVTIHIMTNELDAGPIVEQQSTSIDPDMPGNVVWDELADLGGEMAVRSIERLSNSCATFREQDESQASYFSWPAPRDLVVHPNLWTATRLRRFVTGVVPLGRGLTLDSTTGPRILDCAADAQTIDPENSQTDIATRQIVVQCKDSQLNLIVAVSGSAT